MDLRESSHSLLASHPAIRCPINRTCDSSRFHACKTLPPLIGLKNHSVNHAFCSRSEEAHGHPNRLPAAAVAAERQALL
jgi:hypothetical protein